MASKIKIGMVSLGCDKNRIDAEIMLGLLSEKDYIIVNDEREAEVIIINTCGFIESSKQESINSILEMASNKENGRCKVLIATGCLAERYGGELLSEIPELDAVVGVGNYLEIDSVIKDALNHNERIKKTDNIDYDIDFSAKRVLTTPNYTAYVKIAEGCNNACSYCIIPKLRGIYRSRSMEGILDEVRSLSAMGTKEIILVAQDTSKYGIDIYGRKMLPRLIDEISKIDGIQWIRILYCYPEDIDDALISVIKNNDKVCKYIDIPLQHINDDILNRMGRISSRHGIESLISRLRENIPGIVIRTSLIVGFPGESDQQFNELYDFLLNFKLDRVGVFTYSREENTEAAEFKGQIDEKAKKSRYKKLMMLQRKISKEINKNKVGNVYKVLIEGKKDDGTYIGRTYGDAPEIDGIVYVGTLPEKSGAMDEKGILSIKPGSFISVQITDALDYDLVGVICNESGK